MAANGGMASSSWPTSLAVAAFSSSIRVACPTASGRSANRMSFTSSANRSKSASPDSSTAFAVAASRMVFPQRLAAITAMGSSGTHCISQSSWNVPLAFRLPPGVAQPISNSRRRCRRWLRARSLAWRRSRSNTFRAASGFRRRLFCCCSRSRWSGTVGAVSGIVPNLSPTIS